MKKVQIIIAALCLCTVFTGCGSKAKSETSSQQSVADTTTTQTTTSSENTESAETKLLGMNATSNLLNDVKTTYNISAISYKKDKLIIHQIDDTKKEELLDFLKENNVDFDKIEIGENKLYGINYAMDLLSDGDTMKQYNISVMSKDDKVTIHQLDDTKKEDLLDFLKENNVDLDKIEIGENQPYSEAT